MKSRLNGFISKISLSITAQAPFSRREKKLDCIEKTESIRLNEPGAPHVVVRYLDGVRSQPISVWMRMHQIDSDSGHLIINASA